MLHDHEDGPLVRYLLGRSSAAERDELEDRYFADDALHEQLQAVEEELIDAYVRNNLDSGDRAAFEQRFLHSPERRQKIEFARALADQLRPPQRQSLWSALWSKMIPRSVITRMALAGALAASAVAFFILHRPVEGPPTRASAGAQQPKPPQPVQVRKEAPQAGEDKKKPDLPPVLAFALLPGVRGDGGGNRISIPGGTFRIRLDLAVDEDAGFPHYSVDVAAGDGKVVWRGSNLTRHGRTVAVTLPSAVLPAGNYSLKLSGVDGTTTESVAGFAFAVEVK